MVDTPTKTPYHAKALPEGSILREWKLESVLGVGGFGIVYRGRGVYFDEVVAIKEYFPSAISDRQDGETVTPTNSSSEEVYALGLKKFVEEAKILWNLSKPERHPNIVAVKSLFEIHGTAYMVMDFEKGVSLSQMLRNGQTFDEASLLGLLRPIAEGLDRVHKAGVIHRDIKPANILVDDDGRRPVLIDFGSARFESGQATSTQVTFYTPPYAAIEQYVKTFPQGPWTDIYALGVALYQCVTGEKPGDALERMHGGPGEPLSARERPGFSRTFTRAVDAAMALRPSERPQSMPEWLKMFEPGYDTPYDEPTRISVSGRMRPAKAAPEEAAPAVVDAPAATAVDSETPAAADVGTPAEPPKRRSPPWPLLAGAAVVLLAAGAGGAGYLYLQAHHHGPLLAPAGKAAPATPAASAAAVAAAPAAAAVPSLQPIQDAAAGLVADAQHAGRPRQELGALSEANSKIDALAAQIHTVPAAAAPPLVTQLDGLAVGMARTERPRCRARRRRRRAKSRAPWATRPKGRPRSPPSARRGPTSHQPAPQRARAPTRWPPSTPRAGRYPPTRPSPPPMLGRRRSMPRSSAPPSRPWPRRRAPTPGRSRPWRPPPRTPGCSPRPAASRPTRTCRAMPRAPRRWRRRSSSWRRPPMARTIWRRSAPRCRRSPRPRAPRQPLRLGERHRAGQQVGASRGQARVAIETVSRLVGLNAAPGSILGVS